MANPLPPAQRFRDNTVALARFCADLVVKAAAEGLTEIQPVYVRAGVLFLEQTAEPEAMIDAFITYSYPYWGEIHAKNESFFVENFGRLFPLWEPSLIAQFQSLFGAKRPNGQPVVTTEQREYMWKIFHSLVKIALHHVSESRKPRRVGSAVEWSDPMNYVQVEDLPVLVEHWGIQKTLRA
jgi:hypothetical protein